MDNLEELPVSESEEEVSPKDKEIVSKYFGEPSTKKKGWKDLNKWYLIGIATILFLVLSNSYVSTIIDKIPYIGGNGLMTTAATAGIFFIILAGVGFLAL